MVNPRGKKKVVIIGAGLAGLSAAYFLKKRNISSFVFEKEKKCGGLCRSRKVGGFIFDCSGHPLHFRNPEILSFVKGLLKGNIAGKKRCASVYILNRLIPYPFQTNFYSLDKKIAAECLAGLLEARGIKKGLPKNKSFLGWIYAIFGRGIAKHFMVPYNLKFWRTPLEELTYDEWTEKFIVAPPVEDMIGGLSEADSENLGYSASFWYPRTGGIEELIRAFTRSVKDVALKSEAKSIDLAKKEITFQNGKTCGYDVLISTLPLPELGRIIRGLSKDLLAEFGKLKWVSIYNVNLGVEGDIQPKRHWIYFPEKHISFFRVGFFHNLSSNLAPSGKSSLYVEESYSAERPLDKKAAEARIEKDLKKTGILKKENKICCRQINDIKYGYPVYDKNYNTARKRIVAFLLKNGIVPCGRYGSWRYFSMEDVISESRNIVEELCGNKPGSSYIAAN